MIVSLKCLSFLDVIASPALTPSVRKSVYTSYFVLCVGNPILTICLEKKLWGMAKKVSMWLIMAHLDESLLIMMIVHR